jgi:hypothetical protein
MNAVFELPTLNISLEAINEAAHIIGNVFVASFYQEWRIFASREALSRTSQVSIGLR